MAAAETVGNRGGEHEGDPREEKAKLGQEVSAGARKSFSKFQRRGIALHRPKEDPRRP